MKCSAQPFALLDHAGVADAAGALGFDCDGRVLALNSFENRVFRVGVYDRAPVVLKFYRPGRWSDACIEEEHRFAAELAEAGVSVVAPMLRGGRSLHHHEGHRIAAFPLCGGRAPEPGHRATLESIGRMLGLWHAIGSRQRFVHRPRIDVPSHGDRALEVLLASTLIPEPLKPSIANLGDALLDAIDAHWDAVEPATLRLHGDCHPGNLLWRDGHAHFVDLDDCATGPAMQDLWMLLSGDRAAQREQLDWLLEGYRRFCSFDDHEWYLVEALRGLRLLHHHAWISQRWEDPAFPAAFPWFAERNAWERFVLQLQEQLAELQEPQS